MRSQDLTNNCIIYSIRTIQAGHRWFTPVRVDSTRTLDRGDRARGGNRSQKAGMYNAQIFL